LIGEGMLTAAVCGEVFASPQVKAILAAILHARTDAGTLLVIKNYSGDRLAFALASEQARALGVRVETVYVADDAAVEGGKVIGRRGLAGTVLVHKVAGALAEAGQPLEAVAAAARAVAGAVSTVGASLSVCDIPGSVPSRRLDGQAVEVALGIHGEPGASVLHSLPTANELCDTLLGTAASHLLRLREHAGSAPHAPIPVALLVNNLGGLSHLELGVVVRSSVRWLEGLRPAAGSGDGSRPSFSLQRLVVGPLMTSLDMRGFSLSLLPMDACAPGVVASALDAPVRVPAWPGVAAPLAGAAAITTAALAPVPLPEGLSIRREAAAAGGEVAAAPAAADVAAFTPQSLVLRCAEAACTALVAAAPRLNELDAATGDGDCGSTFATMAAAVRDAVEQVRSGLAHPAASAAAAASGSAAQASAVRRCLEELLGACSDRIGDVAGGTSGVIYALMLRAAGNALAAAPAGGALPPSLAASFTAALERVSAAANAHAGDRTMLDALMPAAQALAAGSAGAQSAVTIANSVAAAAEAGAAASADMVPRAGRASYVDPAVARGHEDPGAVAAAVWLRAVASALRP
jgi:dihydroxyacetone kinase